MSLSKRNAALLFEEQRLARARSPPQQLKATRSEKSPKILRTRKKPCRIPIFQHLQRIGGNWSKSRLRTDGWMEKTLILSPQIGFKKLGQVDLVLNGGHYQGTLRTSGANYNDILEVFCSAPISALERASPREINECCARLNRRKYYFDSNRDQPHKNSRCPIGPEKVL